MTIQEGRTLRASIRKWMWPGACGTGPSALSLRCDRPKTLNFNRAIRGVALAEHVRTTTERDIRGTGREVAAGALRQLDTPDTMVVCSTGAAPRITVGTDRRRRGSRFRGTAPSTG
jgi:hypothetical protein